MTYRELAVPGAWEITPRQHGDPRGVFLEYFQGGPFQEATGHPFDLQQANCSVSAAGVLRGIHFAAVPPGQAKYISCVRGAFLDVVVDVRVGSPTFGQWEGVRLDDDERRAVYLSEGVGHAVCALTDDATLVYLMSEAYNPGREFTVNPLDPDIGIEWPLDVEPVMSPRDTAAPTLAQARDMGILPEYSACRDYIETLREKKTRDL